jgi:periplasmic divalent cation tolerance protein
MMRRAPSRFLQRPKVLFAAARRSLSSAKDDPDHPDNYKGPGGLTATQIFERVQEGKGEGDVYWEKGDAHGDEEAALKISTTVADEAAARELIDEIIKEIPATSFDEIVDNLALIKAVYWWEGKIETSEEILLTFKTAAPFAEVCGVIGGVHAYELPMITAVGAVQPKTRYEQPSMPENGFWKATLAEVPPEAAFHLVSQRVFACAHVMPDGLVVGKTNDIGRDHFQEPFLAEIQAEWQTFDANVGYLSWVSEQVR